MNADASLLLLQGLTTVAVGAISGGVTNAVAIWMLFHPYEPKRVGFFALHGAVPKNKERLAKSIGKTVGERLLTPEDLEHQLTAPGVQEAFERTLSTWLQGALTTERGSLREMLPPAVVEELEDATTRMAPLVADRFVEFAATQAFRDAVTKFLDREAERLRSRPVAEVLTEARQEAIKGYAQKWVTSLTQSEDLERAMREFVDRQVERLLGDPAPLLERMPRGLVATVETGIREYLPVALDRLAALLARPDVREKVRVTVHGLFRRFTQDLLVHERVIARLMVSEKTVERMIDAVERDGAEQIGRLLQEPAMQAEVARTVNDAVVSFLRRPLREHFGSLTPDKLDGLKRTAADYVLSALRDPHTRDFAIQKLDLALEHAEGRTWGDLLRLLPADRAAEWLQTAAQSAQARAWIAEGLRAGGSALLDRRIGRPTELLPEDAPARLTASLAGPLWEWIRRQVPIVVAQLSVREMVEAKVRGFSIQRMEEIVRGVTQRELDLIVRLGYLLGGMVGLLAFLINVGLGALRGG